MSLRDKILEIISGLEKRARVAFLAAEHEENEMGKDR